MNSQQTPTVSPTHHWCQKLVDTGFVESKELINKFLRVGLRDSCPVRSWSGIYGDGVNPASTRPVPPFVKPPKILFARSDLDGNDVCKGRARSQSPPRIHRLAKLMKCVLRYAVQNDCSS
jgi:hypothetical protein